MLSAIAIASLFFFLVFSKTSLCFGKESWRIREESTHVKYCIELTFSEQKWQVHRRFSDQKWQGLRIIISISLGSRTVQNAPRKQMFFSFFRVFSALFCYQQLKVKSVKRQPKWWNGRTANPIPNCGWTVEKVEYSNPHSSELLLGDLLEILKSSISPYTLGGHTDLFGLIWIDFLTHQKQVLQILQRHLSMTRMWYAM